MTDGHCLLQDIRAALEPYGLFLRGTVNFHDGGQGLLLENGKPAASVVLVGNIGSSIWKAFRDWQIDAPETFHPLDDWSKAVIRPMAGQFGAHVFFPSDPPWQPFQQWAMQAEGLRPSPLGILIHPKFGLWHGYRAALAFDLPMPQTGSYRAAHPCDHCPDKPCLTTCPVGAVGRDRFDVPACRTHLSTGDGQAGCMSGGCLARNACPVGAGHRYRDDQLRFHMAALGSFF